MFREVESALKASASKAETQLDVVKRQASSLVDIAENTKGLSTLLQEYLAASKEAYGTWLELQRRAGIHSEILTIPNPHDPRQGLRQNFVGRLEELSILEEATWANGDVAHSMTFKLKEMP